MAERPGPDSGAWPGWHARHARPLGGGPLAGPAPTVPLPHAAVELRRRLVGGGPGGGGEGAPPTTVADLAEELRHRACHGGASPSGGAIAGVCRVRAAQSVGGPNARCYRSGKAAAD